MNQIFLRVRNLFFPRKCVACGALLDWYDLKTDVFCDDCRSEWQDEQLETCGICAKRVTACACVTELMEQAKCKAFRKLVYYRHGKSNAVQNRLIFSIKRVRDRETPVFLAERLLPALHEMQTEAHLSLEEMCVTFVPRSRRAKLEYGIDQAEDIARALSRLSGVSLQKAIIRSKGIQKQQKKLSASARLKNAKDSFVISKTADVRGKTVCLVDDIVTTGASMAACTKLLRRAGAKTVFCLAAASDDCNKDWI